MKPFKDVYPRIRQLGHRIGEHATSKYQPYECIDCGLIADWSIAGGTHIGPLLNQACAGTKEPPPEPKEP